MNDGELTVRGLMDLVHSYYPITSNQEINEQEIMAILRQSEERKAWWARRVECGERWREWLEIIEEANQAAPGYDWRNDTTPICTSQEVVVMRKDRKPLVDGSVDTKLIVRASFLAPVWEAYQTTSVVREVGLKRYKHSTQYRRTHDVSDAFEPAAVALGRAIEARRGPQQRLYEDVTGIRVLNTIDWAFEAHGSTLGELLFSAYAW